MVVSAEDFEKRCEELLEHVVETGETVQIAREGKVIAELVPGGFGQPGFARDRVKIKGDLLQPLDVEWEAQR